MMRKKTIIKIVMTNFPLIFIKIHSRIKASVMIFDFTDKMLKLNFFNFSSTPNNGVTCPVNVTRAPASKDFSPRPHAG